MPHFGVQELLIILVLVLVLFGAKKVPEMARGLGQGLKEFKKSVREASADEETQVAASANTESVRSS